MHYFTAYSYNRPVRAQLGSLQLRLFDGGYMRLKANEHYL